MKRFLSPVPGLLLFLAASCAPGPQVCDLRCEGLREPLAIDSDLPHFSWKIRSEEPVVQEFYEIEVGRSEKALRSGKADLWAEGPVRSADQVMVPYRGKALSSRTLAFWRVRIRTADGRLSKWSRPQRFGIGITGADTLKGVYIGAASGEGRAPLLRKTFTVENTGEEALLHVNSLGYHEAYLNGKKVSDAVLTPAVSQLDKRTLTVTYDVSEFLKKGRNELVLWISSGWYKKRTFNAAYDGPLVKAELDAVAPDGSTPLVWTDGSWEGTWSGYRDYDTWRAHHFGGEIIDARVVPISMKRKDLDRLGWTPVDTPEITGIAATPQMCEPCRIQETLSPVSIEAAGDGSWILDFGRIVNGMAEICLPELPEGHVTTASFSDFRGEDGALDPVSRNEYISSGAPGGDRFANRFNHHVFRYIQLDSLPKAPVKALANRMRTDFPRGGSFGSSDEELNRIHDMVAYTMENLAFDGYMVDCANIERLGYGGDGNASTLSLQILGDVAPLYVNWLQAWNDVIREDGGLPHTAPCPQRAGGGPYWCGFIVQAPWRTYMSYADARMIERCYPTMVHWLDYVDAHTVDGLLKAWPNTEYRHWYLGDWAAPDGVDVKDPESIDLVNNCSLCQVYEDLEKMALLLGKEEEADRFRKRNDALKERIHAAFYHPEETVYGSGSQIDMVYPMLVGAVPDSLHNEVRNKLMERTETTYQGHLATGLVGVPVLTEWATLERECDWFYGMLKKHGYPGYLYMLDNGATGTWEHWNGRRSRLHNCFNGIGSWFYQALGGIIPEEPGYRRIRIEPQIPEGLEKVRVTQNTPYGPILVIREGRKLHVELPVGITARTEGKEYTGKTDLVLSL